MVTVPSWRWPILVAVTVMQLWIAHAAVFFPHEFSHSFVAWQLGWKHNPLGLHIPSISPIVWLLQLGINQNVEEAPIFASGHGFDAGIIAAAGPILGNGLITLPLSRLLWRWATASGRAGWAFIAYWCTVASIGNFFDYVPIRTFTSDGDMGSIERGFGWSPWTVLIVLGIPTIIALVWLFARIIPTSLSWLFPDSKTKRTVVAVLTSAVMFGFFGAAGLLDGGPTSYRLSSISVLAVLPTAIIIELLRNGRRATFSEPTPSRLLRP